MATAVAVGVGVAAAAFVVRSISAIHVRTSLIPGQGRAALVALRRSRGATNALGRAFYKGGFEQTMNRREAALILEVP